MKITRGVAVWVLLMICSLLPAWSQDDASDQVPAGGQRRERPVWEAQMTGIREAAARYHAAETEDGRERAREELRKSLEEGYDPGHALFMEKLLSLEKQIDVIGGRISSDHDSDLAREITDLQQAVDSLIREHQSRKEEDINARLERLLAPRQQRARPAGR